MAESPNRKIRSVDELRKDPAFGRVFQLLVDNLLILTTRQVHDLYRACKPLEQEISERDFRKQLTIELKTLVGDGILGCASVNFLPPITVERIPLFRVEAGQPSDLDSLFNDSPSFRCLRNNIEHGMHGLPNTADLLPFQELAQRRIPRPEAHKKTNLYYAKEACWLHSQATRPLDLNQKERSGHLIKRFQTPERSIHIAPAPYDSSAPQDFRELTQRAIEHLQQAERARNIRPAAIYEALVMKVIEKHRQVERVRPLPVAEIAATDLTALINMHHVALTLMKRVRQHQPEVRFNGWATGAKCMADYLNVERCKNLDIYSDCRVADISLFFLRPSLSGQVVECINNWWRQCQDTPICWWF